MLLQLVGDPEESSYVCRVLGYSENKQTLD